MAQCACAEKHESVRKLHKETLKEMRAIRLLLQGLVEANPTLSLARNAIDASSSSSDKGREERRAKENDASSPARRHRAHRDVDGQNADGHAGEHAHRAMPSPSSLKQLKKKKKKQSEKHVHGEVDKYLDDDEEQEQVPQALTAEKKLKKKKKKKDRGNSSLVVESTSGEEEFEGVDEQRVASSSLVAAPRRTPPSKPKTLDLIPTVKRELNVLDYVGTYFEYIVRREESLEVLESEDFCFKCKDGGELLECDWRW